MRLTADFLFYLEQLQGLAANDNRAGDDEFVLRNRVSIALTHTLATFVRDGDGGVT